MTVRSSTVRRPWTPARIRGLGARTDVPTACEVLGISERSGRELVRTGQFPVPVLRLGAKKQVVPVAPLLALLGLEVDQPAGAPTAPEAA